MLMKTSRRILTVLNITMYFLVIVLGFYIYRMRSQEQRALNASVNILSRQIDSLVQANKNTEAYYQSKISKIGDENKKLDEKLIVIQDKVAESSCFVKDKELIRQVYEAGFLSKSVVESIGNIK